MTVRARPLRRLRLNHKNPDALDGPDNGDSGDNAGHGRADAGALSVELAIILPVILLGFVGLIMLAGRTVQAETEVVSAAQEAARAATFHTRFADAKARADATAAANLQTAGLSCGSGGPQVRTTTSVGEADLEPGVTVTVTVTCTADLRDVAHLGVGRTQTFTATAHEVVDTYRSSP